MRLIVTVLLMTFAGSAWAAWVKYAESKNTVEYYDPATIKTKSTFRRVWMISDLKQRGKYGERSRLFLAEYDCEEKRWRIPFVSAQSEPMAGGETLGTDDSGNVWSRIAPQTAPAIVLQIVCQLPGQRSI
jgi:hypothetical protein